MPDLVDAEAVSVLAFLAGMLSMRPLQVYICAQICVVYQHTGHAGMAHALPICWK